jgi:type II secretory pathway predicted ATPase ExeA
MATSTNQTIQKLMDEVEALDPTDGRLEAKLQLIAQKVAEEQRKLKATVAGVVDDKQLVDPADEFACEGCQ